MLNNSVILTMVKNNVNTNNEISEEVFLDLVSGLEESEVNEVLGILKNNNISISESSVFNADTSADYSKLTRLSNEDLCVMYQKGDSSALEALCAKNEKLVHSIASKILRDYRPEIMDEEDLFIVGNMGLINAADRFISDMGYKFSTYAVWWIRQAISRDVMNNGFRVRLPVHVFEQVRLVNRCRHELPEGTLEDVRERLCTIYGKEYSIKDVEKLVMYGENYLNTYSLNKLIDDEGKAEVINFIPSPFNIEEEVSDAFVKEYIQDLLSILTDRERAVINLHFGLNDQNPMTLEGIGEVFGVTRERIRQIEAKAIKKLSNSRKSHILEGMYAA